MEGGWVTGGNKVFVDLALISKGSRQREEIVMINMLLNKCVGVAHLYMSDLA